MGAHHNHHDHDHHRDHGHDHGPGHAHGHHHGPAAGDYGRAFALGVALNIGFVAIEAGFGLVYNSLALLADAGHNLSDVIGLLAAWGAYALGRVPPSGRYTYGLRGSSILAALGNGVLLMLAAGAIALAAVQRMLEPQPVMGGMMMLVAGVGILVNGATALLFMSGSKGDINLRGAFLHMVADALVSAGVVLAGLGVRATGWTWLDPVASLVIVGVIVGGTWGLLRESLALSLNAVPAGIDAGGVRAYLDGLEGVEAVHDLHIWAMSTTETALTAHLIVPGGEPGDAFLHQVAEELHDRFGIGHSTLQVERGTAACTLAPAEVV